MPKSSSMAENWLTCQQKASFSLILSESVEPIFQSVGPISRHTALKGTLVSMPYLFAKITLKKLKPLNCIINQETLPRFIVIKVYFSFILITS